MTSVLGRRGFIAAGLAAGVAATSHSESPPGRPAREAISLWPGGARGIPAQPLTETMNERSTDPAFPDRVVLGISNPRMTVFRPARPNGAAILIAPGGGYRWVVVDKEGFELGEYLAARGITVFVLFYRLPGEGWAAGPDVVLQDMQRAMRLIRHNAGQFGIDPARVAAMGFSAGGHACADLAARFAANVYSPTDAADRLSARPMLAAPIFPVVSMSAPLAHAGSREKLVGVNAHAAREQAHSPHLHIPADAPPHFILHCEDDKVVPIENSLLLRAALKAKAVKVETHFFAEGGHGFGLRKVAGKPVSKWPDLFLAYARTQGLF